MSQTSGKRRTLILGVGERRAVDSSVVAGRHPVVRLNCGPCQRVSVRASLLHSPWSRALGKGAKRQRKFWHVPQKRAKATFALNAGEWFRRESSRHDCSRVRRYLRLSACQSRAIHLSGCLRKWGHLCCPCVIPIRAGLPTYGHGRQWSGTLAEILGIFGVSRTFSEVFG